MHAMYMHELKRIVDMEFKDIIRQNAWLDDSLDFLLEAIDHLGRGENSLAEFKLSKAKQSIGIWLERCKCLPNRIKQTVADTAYLLIEKAWDINTNTHDELKVDELIQALYELIETAKIVCVIARWEKIREKIDKKLLNANAF